MYIYIQYLPVTFKIEQLWSSFKVSHKILKEKYVNIAAVLSKKETENSNFGTRSSNDRHGLNTGRSTSGVGVLDPSRISQRYICACSPRIHVGRLESNLCEFVIREFTSVLSTGVFVAMRSMVALIRSCKDQLVSDIRSLFHSWGRMRLRTGRMRNTLKV